ncbi:MAG: alpha-D-ribose 1-methylphosphonate 5-triphosphate diphosphatase [Planctomycetota bacterium]|nr:MAG: alpha-D-ribose 1-methylphosphonate 5-triphosphate diphosphatase [Planctomycetota bacterium]
MQKHTPFQITNVHIVTPDEIIWDGVVTINEFGMINEVSQRCTGGSPQIDGQGGVLIPGAVDLHCDALEKLIETRPNVCMPQEHIMPQAEQLYAGAGITTIFHSISFAGDESNKPIRHPQRAREISHDVHNWRRHGVIDHRLHARYEVGDPQGLDVIKALIDEGVVDMVSVMDHSPGQGQFPDFEKFFAYFGKAYNLDEEQARRLAASKQENRSAGWRRAVDLILYAIQAGLPVASHDDDSAERVRFIQELGGRISEFPVNLETARCAHASGLRTIMGAPNIVRGSSQSGNMRAIDAVQAGVLDCLCADYVPWTLVAAAFKLPSISDLSLVEAVQLIATNPATAANLMDRGSIRPGLRADLVLLQQVRGLPMVAATWSGGQIAYQRNVTTHKDWDRETLFSGRIASPA